MLIRLRAVAGKKRRTEGEEKKARLCEPYTVALSVESNQRGIGGRGMISNQILQNTIDGLKNITRIDMCIADTVSSTRLKHLIQNIR